LDSSYRESLDDIDQSSNYFECMLANKFQEEKGKIKWNLGVIVQPKLDGIRAIITKDGATTRKGKQHMCIPHILKDLKPLFDADPNLILDGEVYSHELHDDFTQMCSIVRKMKPSPEDLIKAEQFAQFHCYDCPQIQELTQKDSFNERYARLQKLLNSFSKYIYVVPNLFATCEEDIPKCHDAFVADGYEGIIIRAAYAPYINGRCDYLLKYKVFDDAEFIIEGVNEGEGGKANMAATVTCTSKSGQVFYPTIKAPHKTLKSMWRTKNQYIGKTITVRYFGLYKDTGIPRFPYMIDIDRWIYE